MPELMRRHVNTDMLRDRTDDLDCERCLVFADALFRDEEVAIRVSAKAWQDETAIPSQVAGNLVRNLSDDILLFAFRVPGGNVKDQLTT